MKATCTHCGKPIELHPLNNGYWLHEPRRWEDDNGYYCFENISQFKADPRSMKEIRFRESFNITYYDKERGEWYAKNCFTGQKQVDPFLNQWHPLSEKAGWLSVQVELLGDKIIELRSMLEYYERR